MQNPELALWRTVLVTGLRATDADVWTQTADFRHVCALSGLDHEAVRDAWRLGRVAHAYAVRPARAA